jgi:ABC-2 type transport system ATP-binding protein
MNHTLTANNVSKQLKSSLVLNNINLSLTGGNVYAFQGENGCGKTMLFRVLSGLSRPTEGTVLYDGIDINRKHRELFKIGIVIENCSMFPQFTAMQNLSYLAQINGIIGKNEIINALERVGLDPNDTRTVRKFSLGMRQRLLIAQAIMEAPDFLFLDEPTNAIDRDGVGLVHDIIRAEAERGAVVLLASHIDKDVSDLANHRFLMERGEIADEK